MQDKTDFRTDLLRRISPQNNPMDTLCPRSRPVPGMGSMDGAMVARNIPDPAFRHIHNRLHTPDMVEKKPQQDTPCRHELGRRHSLRARSGLLRLRIRRTELPNTPSSSLEKHS